ncbi:MAG: C69 family dipeptidase [Melioribacteraceae bacterium]|nr:C69 family dipeptidase [Melioribacteraceae bacterium]
MKKFMNLFTAIILLLAYNNSDACTNLIVTRGASSDGSIMITYSADSYNMYGELYHFKAAIYPNGAKLEVYEWDTGKYLGTIPQAKITYNVVGNINEHQVVIGETTFTGRKELIDSKGIIDYGSLMYIALQRSKSAREAIKVMTDLVTEHGYYSSGESFSIGDKNEAWILELNGKGEGNTGAVWVARRIPDGYVSGHANQSRITTFPLDDPENCIYSEDVISFAREKGYYSGSDEEFDFAAAYNPLDFGGIRYCDARVWSMFRRVNNNMDKYLGYIKGESLERMPLWIKPDKKVSVHDVMQLMRDHYEGTEFDMTKGVAAGPYNMPYRCSPLTFTVDGEKYFNERPISTYQTGFSFVSQSRSHLPNEVGGVLWFGVDDTYMTVYSPMYCSITELPYNYREGLASLGEFNWDAVFWVFNAVSNFVYPRYSLVIDDLQSKQRELEGRFLNNQETIENTALSLLKKSRGEAIRYLTEYSNSAGMTTYNAWKKNFEFLNMKYMDGVVKDEYSKPKRVGYPPEFLKFMADEGGDAIKVKKLKPEIDASYTDNINKGDEYLQKREYEKAVTYYSSALDLKPDEKEPAQKIEKIKLIQNSIEELHNTQFNE